MLFNFTKEEARKLSDLVHLQYGYEPDEEEIELLNKLNMKLYKAWD